VLPDNFAGELNTFYNSLAGISSTIISGPITPSPLALDRIR
jgi:hypothetical protein